MCESISRFSSSVCNVYRQLSFPRSIYVKIKKKNKKSNNSSNVLELCQLQRWNRRHRYHPHRLPWWIRAFCTQAPDISFAVAMAVPKWALKRIIMILWDFPFLIFSIFEHEEPNITRSTSSTAFSLKKGKIESNFSISIHNSNRFFFSLWFLFSFFLL